MSKRSQKFTKHLNVDGKPREKTATTSENVSLFSTLVDSASSIGNGSSNIRNTPQIANSVAGGLLQKHTSLSLTVPGVVGVSHVAGSKQTASSLLPKPTTVSMTSSLKKGSLSSVRTKSKETSVNKHNEPAPTEKLQLVQKSYDMTIDAVLKRYAEEEDSTTPKDAIDCQPTKDLKHDGNLMQEAKRRKGDPSRHWTKKETNRFHLALQMVGMDFGLMETIFPNRDRTELKRKCHFEELNNPERVQKSISSKLPFNPELLKEGDDSSCSEGDMDTQSNARDASTKSSKANKAQKVPFSSKAVSASHAQRMECKPKKDPSHPNLSKDSGRIDGGVEVPERPKTPNSVLTSHLGQLSLEEETKIVTKKMPLTTSVDDAVN